MHEKPMDADETLLVASEVLKKGIPFMDHFNIQIDPTREPLPFIEALSQLDPRFQGERDLVRWQLEDDQTQWDDETKHMIMQVAESMGMVRGETPLIGHYDAVIVLGGARQANLDRARYAVDSLHNEQASFGRFIVAGSSRKLNDAEQSNTSNYAPGAETEFDLCVGAARTVAIENPGMITSTVFVEDEKAGTPIVIEEVLKALQASEVRLEEASVAAVTTQIYQESTALDLARVTKLYGIRYSFAAGNPSDPEIISKRTPATYLTEIIRTLKAATLAAQKELV